MHHNALMILFLIAGMVNAQSTASIICPPQTRCLGDEVKLIAEIDLGDLTEKCTDCTCTVNVETMQGEIVKNNIVMTNKGNGFYSFIPTSPVFDLGKTYALYMTCSDTDAFQSNGCAELYIKECETVTESGSYLDYFSDYLPDVSLPDFSSYLSDYDFSSLNPFSKYTAYFDELISKTKSFIDSAANLGNMTADGIIGLAQFITNPAGFLIDKAIPNITKYFWDLVVSFFYAFLVIEICMLIFALLSEKDFFIALSTFVKYNFIAFEYFTKIFMFVFHIITTILQLMISAVEAAIPW